MCLSEAHEFAKQELFKAVRLFMERNKIASAVLKDGDIVIIVGVEKWTRELVEKTFL